MFGWFFGKSGSAIVPILFQDPFAVIDLEQLTSKNRVEIEGDGCMQLCSNMSEASHWSVYYEVIYCKEKMFSFLVYHTVQKKEAHEMFLSAKATINVLDQWFTTNKDVVADYLRLIMESLRINPRWTCAHVYARLGTFDCYFVDELSSEMVNAQVEPDMYTPLHLAIKQFNLPTVRLLLAKKPNLDLVNFKSHSVLHYAAVSTQEILTLILAQDGMFDRILWKDVKGCTALHLACFIQKFDIVFEFLKFGLTVRMLTLSPPNSRPKTATNLPSDSNPQMTKVVHFNDQDFDDIDCQDIFCGGCPLHWVKHKRLMEKLLAYPFPLNTRNCNGESPLHVVAKRLRLKCVIALLCAGCNVNSMNIFGNTPLHLAVKENDLVVPQTLIVFDASIDSRNYSNESVRHVAAKSCKSASNEAILYLLSALGAKRCPPPKEGSPEKAMCNIGCSFSGNFEGNICEKLYGVDQKYDRLFKEFLFGDIIQHKLNRSAEQLEKEKGVNMLCLDGGGIKGLVTLQMLKEVERYLKHPLNAYFKWLAGTSTGSFICAFLATGISLTQIRATYFRLKDKVLTGAKPYSSDSVEDVIRGEVGAELRMADILDKFGKYMIVPSVVANRRPMKLHVFRSFPSVQELFESSGKQSLVEQTLPDRDKDLRNYKKYESRNIEVWKACRASGAAPTYFRAFGDFLDGGLIANNPTLDALSEFEQYNGALRAVGHEDRCCTLDAVISVGTGKSLLEECDTVDVANFYSVNNIRQFRTFVGLLIYEVCQTEQHITTRAESFCYAGKVPFFRLNSFLSEMMELDEQQDYKIINCLWETKRFMYYRRDQVKVLVNYLEKCTQGLPPAPTKKAAYLSKTRLRSRAAPTPRPDSAQSTKSLPRQSSPELVVDNSKN